MYILISIERGIKNVSKKGLQPQGQRPWGYQPPLKRTILIRTASKITLRLQFSRKCCYDNKSYSLQIFMTTFVVCNKENQSTLYNAILRIARNFLETR